MMTPLKDFRLFRALFLTSGLALLAAHHLAAQTATYIPTSGTSSWNEGANWSTGLVPSAPGSIALLPQANLGTTVTNITGFIELERLEANLMGGSWRVAQIGAGGIRWSANSGTPTVFVASGATAQSLTIQARLLDPLSGPATALSIDGSGQGNASVLFTGDNSGFTGGFHLKASSVTSLVFTTSNTMASNDVLLSGGEHRLRFGTGQEIDHFYGNISAGEGVSMFRISPNATAGGSAVLHGVISGDAGVDFRRYNGGDIELRGNNTYTGRTLIVSGINITFNSVANFGLGNDLELGVSSGSPTLIYAAGNSDDLTKKPDGSQRNVNFRNAKGTIDTNGNNVTFENRITSFMQAGTGLVKKGDGVLRLVSGENAYGLETEVLGGTLLVSNTSGSATGASSVVVKGTLGGNGRMAPGGTASIRIENGGVLAPGDPLENQPIDVLSIDLTATTGSLIFADASRLAFDLGEAGASDLLSVASFRAGSIIFEGESVLDLFDLSLAGLDEGDYRLFSAQSAEIYSGLTLMGNEIVGGLVIGSISDSYRAQLLLEDGDILLRLHSIPEPSSLALLAIVSAVYAYRRQS